MTVVQTSELAFQLAPPCTVFVTDLAPGFPFFLILTVDIVIGVSVSHGGEYEVGGLL
jgi:hypothetical protein